MGSSQVALARVQSLGREDPLEKGMATQSSILAWRIPWTEGPSGLQPIELDMLQQRIGHDWNNLARTHSGGLVAKSCPILATSWTLALQAPLSIGFSEKEYWSGLSFPSPVDIPIQGIKPHSPALKADSLLTELPGKPTCTPPLLLK